MRTSAPASTDFTPASTTTSAVACVKATKSEEPNTISFYKKCARNLLAWPELANSKLNEITSEKLTAYIEQRREAGCRFNCSRNLNGETHHDPVSRQY